VGKLKAIIDSAKRAGIDKSQPPRQMPDEAARQAIRPTEKTIDDFSNEDSFYRIVDEDAYIDLVNSGAVRTNFGNKPGSTITDKLASRPTRYPSFSKGSANKTYAEGKPNHYIIETKDPSIKPSTEGRHGKGTTQFPTDSTGVHLESLPGEAVQVYRHIGDGQYRLVYDQGKVTPKATNAETKVAAPLGNISIPIAAAIAAGTMTPQEAQAGPVSKALAELAKRADAGDEAARQGIRGYHGSPYNFPPVRELEMPDGAVVYQSMDDAVPEGARVIKEHPLGRFDMSKIGTGEGAQAYSRGLYFAEREATGQSYRDTLSRDNLAQRAKDNQSYDTLVGLGLDESPELGAFSTILSEADGDMARAIQDSMTPRYPDDPLPAFAQSMADAMKSGRLPASIELPTLNKGSMYEVNIAATPDEFIDWDLPLDEQSESVMNALNKTDWYKYAEEGAYEAAGNRGDNPYGMDLVRWLEEDGAEDAVQMLKDAGIKGVQYADAQTRFGKGPKTKNYVVYDDKLIDIIKKYGVSVPIAVYIAEGIITPEEAQAVGFGSVVKKSLSDKTDEIQQGIGSLPAGDEMVTGGDLQFLMNKLVREQSVKQAKEQGLASNPFATGITGLGAMAALPSEEAQAGPLSAAGRAAQKGFTKDVYHGTTQDFDQVDPDAVDLGIHVGTPAQAANRLRDTTGNRFSGSYDEGANIMPLKARMNNTLEMEDAGDWKDSYQVLGSLRNTPVGRKNRAKIQEMEEQADEIMGQYAYGDEEWRDSPENRELLDEINTMLADSGYDSIRYKNQVENTYGSSAGLTPQAEQRKAAISKEINALDRKLYARKPDMPAMDDPDLAAKMDAFLSFDANKERTPADAARRQQLLDENMAISEDPANQADTNSYIILDPDANLRSRNAKFMDERGNLLASVGTGLGVAVAAGSAPEAQAGVISIPTQGIRSLGQTLEFDPRFDPRKREQEGLQSLQFDFLPRNEAMIKPSLRLSDLEGEDFVTSMSDRTRAGGMIMGINGVPLYRAVDLRGGQDFMFENPNQVWASARVPSEKILEMAREFQGQSGKDPLFIPWRMAPTGGDFSNMVGELMLGFASSNMDKATKKAFDVAIREYKTKGSMDKGVRKNAGLKIKEWPGVDDPKAVEIWRSTPDAVRKELMNMMDVQFRNKGGLSIGSARLVASDPTQLMSRDAGLQNVGRIYTGQDITPSTHPSYPYAVPGEGIGTLKGADEVTIFDLLPEARFGDAQKKVKDPANPTQQEIRALQMKPYGGTITENILRRIEERGVNVNSLTGLTPGALAFTLTSAGLLTPEEAAAGGLDEAAEIFSGTKGGNQGLVPFDKDIHTSRDVGLGGPSSEYTMTVDAPDGQVAVIPSIWWDTNGEPVVLDQRDAERRSFEYEQETGKQFPRFPAGGYELADEYAQARTRQGGASESPLASEYPSLGGMGVTSRAMPDEVAFKAPMPDEVAFKAPREPRRIPPKQPPGIASLAGQLGLGAMSEIGGAIFGGLAGAAEYGRGSGPSMGGMAGAPATAESIRNINEGVSGYVGDLYDAGPEAQALGQQIMQGIGETIAPIAEYAMEGDITDEYGINMLPLIAQKLGIPLYELLERVYSMMPELEQEAAKSGADAFL
jgi:hypothetical protein